MDVFEAIRDGCDAVRAAQAVADDPGQVHSRTRDNDQPLHLAVWQRCHEIAELLLKRGADPNAPGNNGLTPLHYAAEFADARIVDMLVAAGADLDARDDCGMTPLHRASRNKKVRLHLIGLGAAVDVATSLDLEPPTRAAARIRRDPGMLKTPEGRAALGIAIRKQDVTLVQLLIEQGADPDVGLGTPPLVAAVSSARNDPNTYDS
jgi:ankyrin repeat protein